MKSEFMIAITQLAAEKNLPQEVVLQAMEAALVSAYKKDVELNGNVAVRINRDTGDHHVYMEHTVVQEVADASTEIGLIEARRKKPDVMLGDILLEEVHPGHGGRIAAQTAKQVVLQRLREAEREMVFEEFSNREGDIVTGVIQRLEPKHAVVDLGKTEAILPIQEQVRAENLRAGARMKFYLLEVHKGIRGPQLILSRTHKGLLKRLFELEVPEIHRGIVEIKSIAREGGYRSKVAVMARQEGVDPVGSCVGLRGIRIQNIVNELNGERIDVIQWDPEPGQFVANALSPAQVLTVQISEDDNTASVIVPDRQLSLAIGKEGQNARLAAKLTGWRIDIKPESAMGDVLAAVAAAASAEAPAKPKKAPAPEVPTETDGAEPPPEVREPEPDMATLLAEAEAPKRVAPVEATDGPRIRFAEELSTTTTTKVDPKKKKTSKKEERPEADAKVVKKTPKRDKRLAAATDDEDEDLDLELDWGGKDGDDDDEI